MLDYGLGHGVLYVLLNGALERACAVLRVVAAFCQKAFGGQSNRESVAGLLHSPVNLFKFQLHNLCNILLRVGVVVVLLIQPV